MNSKSIALLIADIILINHLSAERLGLGHMFSPLSTKMRTKSGVYLSVNTVSEVNMSNCETQQRFLQPETEDIVLWLNESFYNAN